MDLGTVKKNLKSNKYTTVEEVVDEIQLIWTNCKTYNVEGSEIWKLAATLEKQSGKLLEKYFKPTGRPVKPLTSSTVKEENSVNNEESEGKVDSLSLQEKISLTERVRKLSNEGLAAFVKLVQKECGSAYEDMDSEKIQIRVDFLDRSTYLNVESLLDNFLNKVR